MKLCCLKTQGIDIITHVYKYADLKVKSGEICTVAVKQIFNWMVVFKT